ncbi:hypothetical protein RX717_08985 [Intestinibacillus sp. NTUH-41-i26]|uniref:hypothetical protein n=1 Tax=Intestinibacillus sp. NTUH-41-i26 TaxID=3079303 RepID=UPI002934EF46|nr:hypothetical protein [Intestinibacillus sp. NTUH-41-i26]WOC74162.1 hypothetical protein RX717_08985 [Intestinibacillus sp. NTUH-41-i26]
MTFFDDPILPQTPKMQELSDIIKRSHETGQDYQAIKHLIDQSSLTLGEKMALICELDKKFTD